MSMISSQIDSLRKMSRFLNEYSDETIARELNDAADTIDTLRTLDFSKKCRMGLTDLPTENVSHVIYVCSECGGLVTIGAIAGKSEPPRFCPHCGYMVIK